MSAVLIKNGLVYDGTGVPPKKTDVLVQRARVARLGDIGRREAERVIDATGATVIPGVVEMDFEPESEDEIFSAEAQHYLLRRGITTVVDGTDGNSLAPLLLPLRHASHSWRTLGEFRRTFERMKPALNFGTLVGYAGLRAAFTGGEGRDLDPREMEQLALVVRAALKEGALGIGLGDLEALRLPDWELLALALEASRAKKVLALHLSGGAGELGERLGRVLAVGKKSGASIEFTHFEPRAAEAAAVKTALGTIEKQAARAHVGFDVFPLPYAHFGIASFLPHWFRSGTLEATLADLKSAHAKDRVLEHFKKLPLAEMRVAEAPRHLKFLKGKRIGDLAASWGTRPERAFLKLALTTGLKCHIADPGIDGPVLEEIVGNARTILTLSFHEAEGDFKEIFAAASSGGKLPQEQIIAKLTGAPAKKLGLQKRGLIAPDHFADIVILRDDKVQSVFVGGVEVFADGVFSVARNGLVL